MKKFVILGFVAGLAGCGGTSIPVVTSTPDILMTENPATQEVSFASLLNTVRLDNGVGTVAYNGQLDAVAQAHADDMIAQDYFDHVGKDGSTIGDRARRGGYAFSYLGENIASGQQTEAAAMNGWVGSPGHQANNINPEFTEFGLGFAKDGTDTRWVLMLGAPL